MSAFLQYVLESGVCLALFYAGYWLFLKKETYFVLNRIYLVSSLVLSFAIPALNVASPFLTALPAGKSVSVSGMQTLSPPPLRAAEILLAVYAAGAFIFFIRFVFHLARLYTVVRRCGVRNYRDIKVVSVGKDFSPFSFLNIVFINDRNISEDNLQRILAHERVHILQHHSLDILLIEMVIIFQWFNPFVWPYKKSLQETHEYLADHGVIAQGFSAAMYQLLMFEQHVGVKLFEFANNFKQSQIKRRLTMISKIKSKNAAKLKLLLVLPLASFLVLAFADPRPTPKIDDTTVSAPQENPDQSQVDQAQKQKVAQATDELKALKHKEATLREKLKAVEDQEKKKELKIILAEILDKQQKIQAFLAKSGVASDPTATDLRAEYQALQDKELKIRAAMEKTDDPQKKADLKAMLVKVLDKQSDLKAALEEGDNGGPGEFAAEELEKEYRLLKAKEEDLRTKLEKTEDPQEKAKLENTLKKVAEKQAMLKEKAQAMKKAQEEKK